MRKVKFVTLIDDGQERLFKIQQMPALKQERWINRLIVLLAGKSTSVKLPDKFDLWSIKSKVDSIMESGENSKDFSGFAKAFLQILGSLNYEDVEPLYNELLECCEYVPNPKNKNYSIVMTPQYAEGVIGDFRTLYRLRIEAVKTCFGFFEDGDSSPTTPEKTIRIAKPTRT